MAEIGHTSGSGAAATALPAAGAVARVRAASARWAPWQKALIVGSSVGGVGLILIGLLTSGGGEAVVADEPVTTYASVKTQPGVSANESITVDPDRVPGQDKDAVQPGDAPDDVRPDDSTPGAEVPGDAVPGAPDPGTDPGVVPGAPGEVVVPGGGGTTPPPATPTPVTPTAKPLALAGIVKNEAIGLLGISVVSSYTLSVTGQPGATASVKYGTADAGTVTFDGSGFASIEIGGRLLDLGLSDPVIVVAYSDGTPGSAIQARRDSI